MPRMARVVIPKFSHHIVQRGHNRQLVFAEDADYVRYLENLEEFRRVYRVKIYAWCLMTNHVHLLLAPDDPNGIGKLMKRLAGRQTQYHNRLEGRSGTLWEGRYKSSPVQSETYLLACCRYIELNPVRARVVTNPLEYKWSSCRARFGRSRLPSLDLDPCYLALGANDPDRQRCYEQYLSCAIPRGEWKLIREAVQRGQLTGNDRFREQVAKIIGKRIEYRGPGRPSRNETGIAAK